MGEARRKLTEGAKPVIMDLSQPKLAVMRGDREFFSKMKDGSVDETQITSKAVRMTISSVVQAAFPQGMAKQDRKVWAAWLEILEDEDTTTTEVPWSQVEWLRKLLEKEDLKIQPALAQWCEALETYLESLKPCQE